MNPEIRMKLCKACNENFYDCPCEPDECAFLREFEHVVLTEKGKQMKDVLIELIQEAVGGCDRYWAGLIANHLISYGVSIGNGETEFDYEAEDD